MTFEQPRGVVYSIVFPEMHPSEQRALHYVSRELALKEARDYSPHDDPSEVAVYAQEEGRDPVVMVVFAAGRLVRDNTPEIAFLSKDGGA